MTDDATLSSFGTDPDDDVVSESTGETGSAADSESARTSTADAQTKADTETEDKEHATDAPAELTPSLATYAVQPPNSEPAHTCRKCGSESRHFWCDDGQFVCPDCKAW
ncbi:DUF7573 domain-containing protein [Natrialba sp. SSL1]|uniref:DUF7573 domain-containing protein n=1 Tax=Natrialba sp. SSL1 TaxID=1869245 RepID=UPI0008F8FA78|nr:hypothetical protein [Natrialba sp. SSL1]OIB58138.1 hypothetical protein BBD46_10035 [Natrialba sp. SSL1]